MERTTSKIVKLAALASVLAAGPVQADTASDQYTVAADHYANARWDLAAVEFEKFLVVYPDHAWRDRAIFYHGEALVQLRQFEPARQRFQELLTKYPASQFAHNALFRSGEAAYLSGKLPTARTDLKKFVDEYSEDPLTAYALPYLGEIALAQSEPATAEKLFTRALERYPNGPMGDDCRVGLARAWHAQHLEDKARQALEAVVADSKSGAVAQALFELGHLLYRQGDLDGADAQWAQLTEQYPNSPWRVRAELGRGWLLFKKKEYDKATKQFTDLSAESNPASIRVEALYRLALVQRAQQQWERAAKTLLEAEQIDPQHQLTGAIRYHLGDSLLMLGRHDEADRQFDRVLTDAPTGNWADDALLGKMRSATGRKDLAAVEALADEFSSRFAESPLVGKSRLLHASALIAGECYDEALVPLQAYLNAAGTAADGNLPHAARCRAELAICYARLNRLDEAKSTFAALLENHANDEVVLPTTRQLARIAFAAGQREWSKQLYERLANDAHSDETTAESLLGLAWSQFQTDDLDAAEATFGRFLEEHPDDERAAEAALARGQILERLEKFEPALVMYRRVIDKYGDSMQAPDALLGAARICDHLEENQQAQDLYERLIAEHPTFANLDEALYGCGWALREEGKYAQSLDKFRQLHQDYPQSEHWSAATYLLAEDAAAEKRYDEAEALLRQIVDPDSKAGTEQPASADSQSNQPTPQQTETPQPDNDVLARALYLQGRIALVREQWEDVAPPLQRIVNELPQSSLRLPALYWLAEARFRAGDFEAARVQFDSLAEQMTGRQEEWLAIIPLRQAQILAQEKKWDEALELARSIESRFPQHRLQFEVDYLIGRCLSARGELSDAREAYLRVVRASTDHKSETAARAQWMIGETYMHQKQYEQARREYLRGVTLYAYPEWQARSLLQAGKCHELQGQWEQAISLYNELKTKFPTTASVEEADQRLRVAQQHVRSQS